MSGYSTKRNLKELAKNASQYCVGFEGNISGKINDESFLIKASGTSLKELSDFELIEYDFNSVKLSKGTMKGSMELPLHIYLLGYKDINYVSHTHPVETLKILCGKDLKKFGDLRMFPDQVIFNGAKSCVVGYRKPGLELALELKNSVDSFIKNEGYFPKVILLENHGIITCGSKINECIIATDICEKSAQVFNGFSDKNNIKYLTDSEILDLESDENEKYRMSFL